MFFIYGLLFLYCYPSYKCIKTLINEKENGSFNSTIQATCFRHLSRDKRIVMNLESKMDYLTEKSFILSSDGVAKFLLKNEIAKFVETATKEIANQARAKSQTTTPNN
jgi:hypothetical protein